jgi:pre-mRNA-splicing factor 38A
MSANNTALGLRIQNNDPQSLISSIQRDRIYESTYWKDRCFALNAETLLDRAKDLDAIGLTYGGASRPTHFLCLLLKLLQIQPDLPIIKAYLEHSQGGLSNVESVQKSDLRYLRALAAVYVRLVGTPETVFMLLEPILSDARTLSVINSSCKFDVVAMDELIEFLLGGQTRQIITMVFPYLPKRHQLAKKGSLLAYSSVLDSSA